MTDTPDNSTNSTSPDEKSWSGTAIAGAAIGSAALAAALLFVSRRRDAKSAAAPIHPETAPETD